MESTVQAETPIAYSALEYNTFLQQYTLELWECFFILCIIINGKLLSSAVVILVCTTSVTDLWVQILQNESGMQIEVYRVW